MNTTVSPAYLNLLSDLLFSEKALVSALAKLSVSTASPALAGAYNDHQDETREHERRLYDVLARLNNGAETVQPDEISVMPLIHDGDVAMADPVATYQRDEVLIALSRRVEQHEIAAYGEALSMARTAGDDATAVELQRTLDEELNADAKLAQLARGHIPQPSGRVVSEVSEVM